MIRSDEAMVLLLDKLVQKMDELNKQQIETTAELTRQGQILNEQTPEGIVEPLAPMQVTTTARVFHPPYEKKWFSITIENDGPNDCNVIVNTEKSSSTPYPLRVGGTYELDVGMARIEDIRVYCDAGTANLRIKGLR